MRFVASVLLLPLLLLLPAGFLGGCGIGDQSRPFVVSTWPAAGDSVLGPVSFMRVTYNEDVTILNQFDGRVLSGPNLLPTIVAVDPHDRRSVLLGPSPGSQFPIDTSLTIYMVQGVVTNAAQHYADVIYQSTFEVTGEPSVPVTRPGMVTLLDPATFTAVGSTPTPVGREPVAAMRTGASGIARIWVQLDNGAGTGAALASYAPGDPMMTVTTLEPTAGGDLSAPAPALIRSVFGEEVYAAYRDELSGTVRVYEIDIETGTQLRYVELESVAAGPMTAPAGLVNDRARRQILIACHDGATGTLAYVDTETFTEIDRDAATPGIQGVTLPTGAGPVAYSTSNAIVAPTGMGGVAAVNVDADSIFAGDSNVVGTSVDIMATVDFALTLQPMAAFDGNLALQTRGVNAGFRNSVPTPVSDDVGGISTGATDCVAIQRRPGTGGRFFLLLDRAGPGGLILTSWTQSGGALTQEDLDPVTDGVQAVNVSAVIPGATTIGRTYGITPPPPP